MAFFLIHFIRFEMHMDGRINLKMCISKRIKRILKKKPPWKNFFLHFFFQYPHHVDIKNVVECPREFIAYFNALETTCGRANLRRASGDLSSYIKMMGYPQGIYQTITTSVFI